MGVKSAGRTFEILELLMTHYDGLILKDIADILGYAPSSTYELVKTMADHGYLHMDSNKKYHLGAKLIQLGECASRYLDINKIAGPILRSLMEEVQETIFMAILSDKEIIYVSIINSSRSISTNARMGVHKPLYCTGLGKAFLAFLPSDESNALIQEIQFEPFTKHTITDKELLIKQLEVYRAQGFATDHEEIEEGLWCVARPVYNYKGHMEAAVSISGPINRIKPHERQLAMALKNATEQISSSLGYRSEDDSLT